MNNIRRYGTAPFNIALVHGGPGALGEMAPVAVELARDRGVLEPLQTVSSLDGLVGELRSVLLDYADLPVVLAGYSWGAWLGLIMAAQYPELVRKLVLISSGPFEQRYADGIMQTRLDRLDATCRTEVLNLQTSLAGPASDKDGLLARFGELISLADSYDKLLSETTSPDNSQAVHADESAKIDCSYEIFSKIWNEAMKLRMSGRLLLYAEKISCPVVAIHGSYDPHPVEGVREPLSAKIRSFRCIVLDKCGHTPWLERQARDRFFRILREEVVS